MRAGEFCRQLLDRCSLKYRFKEIETFATKTELFKGVDNENKQFTKSFIGKNCLKLNDYLSLLYGEEFFPLVQLSVNFHEGDKRKATEDPYFKHIFYTSYLSYGLSKILEYDEKQTRIFVVAALFHDAIEMRKKTNPGFDANDLLHQIIDQGMDKAEAEKIFTIVSLLTPEPKEANMDMTLWMDRKNTDFGYIMKINGEQVNKKYVDLFGKNPLPDEETSLLAEMVKQIKITDDTAILREIKDDITYKRDTKGEERNGIRTLDERFNAYKYRTDRIFELYNNHPLLKQMQSDLRFIQKHLRLS